MGQRGRRDAHEANAAVEERGGQAGGVEERPAADREAERMAADVARLKRREHLPDRSGRLFDALASGQRQRGADQMQRVGVRFEIGADLRRQLGKSGARAAVQQDQAAVAAVAAAARQGVAQRAVARRKQMAGENDRKGVADDDFLEMDTHAATMEAFPAPERFTPVSRSPSA